MKHLAFSTTSLLCSLTTFSAWAQPVPPPQTKTTLLREAVSFTGTILFLSAHVPGMVLAVVQNGEMVVEGFGTTGVDGHAPDGDTIMRVGSISKVFTGAVLASMVADGTVHLTDPASKYLDWGIPTRDGKSIRLIDLATHASGLPREVDAPPGPRDNPMKNLTADTFRAALKTDPLLFTPGTGALYSNFGFGLLAATLQAAGKQGYETALQTRVLAPAQMISTSFAPSAEQKKNMMQGHDFDGSPMLDVPTGEMTMGSGGLYSSANDILRWAQWHLARFDTKDAEMRLLDHTPFVARSMLSPAYGLDESGYADAIGLGWIVMHPKGDRPLILQKAGGRQGMFSYIAMAPSKGIAVFVAINAFDVHASMEMTQFANDLIGQLAPRD